jgi:hypothetical protein
MKIIDPISILSVPLTIRSNNGSALGTATGFFWRKSNGKTYLVSNHHVFSGNHIATKTSLRRDSAFPGNVDYPRFVSPQHLHERQLHTIELCDQAGNDPVWKEHPIHDMQSVDLAVIEIPTVADDQSYVYAVNDDPLHECDKPLNRYPPGFGLMIAGFFLKDRPTGYFPTYIQGSVASEMDALYHGKQAFLVDALTSSGMSGSPVFATGMEQVEPDKKFSPFKTVHRLVGIYSGRIVERENGANRELQVGIVWSRELIHETVESTG